jgi:type VI protein secretion system component VasK
LNKALGKDALVGSEIEDLYFYPIDAPKIGGFVPTEPLRFFSFFTLHWTLLWLGLAAFALWRLLPMMGPCGHHYLILLGFWGVLNFIYLAWFFYKARDRHAMASYLKKSS